MKDCFDCGGKGYEGGEIHFSLLRTLTDIPRPCSLCKGSGRIPDNVERGRLFSWSPWVIVCNSCGKRHDYYWSQPVYCSSCGSHL